MQTIFNDSTIILQGPVRAPDPIQKLHWQSRSVVTTILPYLLDSVQCEIYNFLRLTDAQFL
jgi:hypothetical protein